MPDRFFMARGEAMVKGFGKSIGYIMGTLAAKKTNIRDFCNIFKIRMEFVKI